MPLIDMIKPSLVELGSIKIGTLGEERTSKYGKKFRMPVKLDHFQIVTRMRDKHGLLIEDKEVMDSLKAEYADEDGELRRLPIAVLSDDIDDFMRSSWVYYSGKVCVGRSDGKTLWKFYETETDKLDNSSKKLVKLDEPIVREWDESLAHNKIFKKHTALDVVLSHRKARWGGVYRFRTTSEISASNLYGSLIHIKELTMGTLVGMPLELVLRPIQVAPEGKPTTVYVAHVEIRGDDLFDIQQRSLQIAEFQRGNRDKIMKLKLESKLLLKEPGIDESDDEQAEVQQHFHPEESGVEETDATIDNVNRSLMARLQEMGCLSTSDYDAVVNWKLPNETLQTIREDESKILSVLHAIMEWCKDRPIHEILAEAKSQD